MPTALIVEDNDDLAGLIQIHLEDINVGCHIVSDGEAAITAFEQEKYDLVLLDLMLPGINVLDVCRTIRKTDAHLPVLMLTAKSEEIDRVVGLEVGADDYLTKPFGVAELTARVRALLRRASLNDASAVNVTPKQQGKLVHGALSLNSVNHEVYLDGKKVSLTVTEFELLQFLLMHPDQVFSRDELLKKVWGYQNGVYQHTVNSHINRLRRKIEKDPGNPTVVVTVWGVGYRLGELV